MKSNEQKLIDLMVQCVLTMRTSKGMQRATAEEIVTWVRDNLTKLGFNVQEGNQVWIDYDAANRIAEDIYHGARAQHHVWCPFPALYPDSTESVCVSCEVLWKLYPDVTPDNSVEMAKKYHVTWMVQPKVDQADNSRIALTMLQEVRRLLDMVTKKIEALK